MSGHGQGYGLGLDALGGLGSSIVIPTSGPDSFGDGSSLVSWISADDGVTLSGSDLTSVVDNAALAAGALWTANVDYAPASDLNGKKRWNCANADQWLTRGDGGPTVGKGFVAAYYIRMFTTSGFDRVPWGIDTTDKEDALGAISTDYLQDDVWIGNGIDPNADIAGSTSISGSTSYIQVVTYNSSTGEIRVYHNAADITIVTPHTLATSLSFTFNYAWAVGKANTGLWNCGQNFLYNATPDLTLVNQIGQWISDNYGLGQTWSLS